MKVLIFGATGFIGKNLVSFLSAIYNVNTAKIDEEDSLLIEKIQHSDIIINASGVSRSESENDFFLYNIYHSQRVFSIINKFERKMYVYFSSVHFSSESIYGFSKRYNEFLLNGLEFNERNYFLCLRIPSIFGPDMKPNYVSVVANFCNNTVKKVESNIFDEAKVLKLLYIDDLINTINNKIVNKKANGFELLEDFPETVEITVKELFETIQNIGSNSTNTNKNEFLTNLFITYNSYLNKI